MTRSQGSRKERALTMLKAQLESGVKTQKGTRDAKIPLTDKDVKRINREVETLSRKLK
jgi:NAD(P)H-dependent FMN reductase